MSWGSSYRDPHRAAPFAPPTVDPARTRKPSCKYCGADLVYVEMADSGKLMPCDTTQYYGDGRRSLVVRYPRGGPGQRGRQLVGRVIARAGEDVLGLEPHFGTCPVQLRARQMDAARKRAEVARAADGEPATPADKATTIERLLDVVDVPSSQPPAR